MLIEGGLTNHVFLLILMLAVVIIGAPLRSFGKRRFYWLTQPLLLVHAALISNLSKYFDFE